MRRLENDLSAIVRLRSVPDLVALHLCEFGGHGAVVPEHVRQRVARVVGSDWSVVWHNNYVLLWKPARVRMVEEPVLQQVPTQVRAHGDSSNPHTFQMYTCEVEAPHGRSGPLKVVHVHHRSSRSHKWTSGSQGRGLAWLRELTAHSSAWLIGGDLNTPSYLVGSRFVDATCIFDSGSKPTDLALASASLNPGNVTCRVGKHFGLTGSISDAHNVVAVELHLSNVSPASAADMAPLSSKAPPRPKRSAPKGPPATAASAASRPWTPPPPATPPPGGNMNPPPPAPATPPPNPSPAAGLTMPMPPPATPLVQSVPQPPPGLGDSTQSLHVDTPPPSTLSSHVETPPPSSSGMSTPEPPPVVTRPKSGEPQSPASRQSGPGSQTMHVDTRQEQPVAVPVPKSTIMYPPGLCDPFEPSMDICQPVPGAIQQRHFDLPQPQPAALQEASDRQALAHQDQPHQAPAQDATQQQPVGEMSAGSAASRPVALLDGREHDGTEPVDHKDAEVVRQFQKYFGIDMTCEQVMELFEKGEAPPTFVQSGKVMAFDTNMYSYEEFTVFYGTVAGTEQWNFAKRVLQDLLLALHHVQKITNFLRLYAEVHPQVETMRDAVFKFLLDPTRPCQHGDEPRVIVVMRMLLRPLWVRRQRLEQEHGALPRFPQELAPEVLGEVFNEWQHAWYQSNEVTMRDPKKLRNAWFAHLKQRCGGAPWAKLLMQYEPGRMSDLLPVVLDVRADRVEAQAPIMPVARAAMHQRGAM